MNHIGYKVAKNASSMANGLESAQERKRYDQCCGIHGAARERKGIKKATSAARRRNDKRIFLKEIET